MLEMCNVVYVTICFISIYRIFSLGVHTFTPSPLVSFPSPSHTFSSSPSTPSIAVLSLLPSYSFTPVRVSGAGSFIRAPQRVNILAEISYSTPYFLS